MGASRPLKVLSEPYAGPVLPLTVRLHSGGMEKQARSGRLPVVQLSPKLAGLLALLLSTARAALARSRGLLSAPMVRLTFAWAMLIVGLLVQVVLLWLAGYLIDLAISLMELWADLARKHLELTM